MTSAQGCWRGVGSQRYSSCQRSWQGGHCRRQWCVPNPFNFSRSQENEPFPTRFLVLCMQFGERWWYRHACAVGGVFNILLMMGANLVGFVLGVDGAQYFAHELVISWEGKSYSKLKSPSRTSLIDVPTQVFVSSLSHVLVCSLAYRSCLNTGMSFRIGTRLSLIELGRLGKKSYVGEYNVDAKP